MLESSFDTVQELYSIKKETTAQVFYVTLLIFSRKKFLQNASALLLLSSAFMLTLRVNSYNVSAKVS